MKINKYYKLCLRLCNEQGGLKDDSKCNLCPLCRLHCGYFFDDLEYEEIQDSIKQVTKVLKSIYPEKFRRKK